MAEGVTGPVPPPQILGSYISDISEDERRRDRKLRIKLDVIFMTYVTLSYTLKFLDQSNYTYAYVSGMQENLSLYGNELTWMGTIFSIGYILGTIPTQLLLTYIRPSYFLGSVEMVWGVFVLCMAAAKSVHTIYAMRFLIGLFEASSYPGLIAVMAAWYTPKELGKRVAILQSASALGAMWAGYLQAAVFAGLNGTHGLPGWKWGFIVNGAITIPVGLLGYFCIPDSPANTRARWLSSSDIALAKLRMARVGRAPARGLSKRTLVKVFTTWPLYAFILPYGLWVINGQAIGFFSLWLKSTKRFSTVKVNLIPTGGYALEIVTAILWAGLSDAFDTRWPLIVVSGLFGVFGSIVLTIWNVSFGLHFAGHILIFATIGGSALILTWVSEVAGGDAEARILIVAILNTFAYVLNAALPFVMYPSKQAPHYKYGYQISLGFWLVAIAMIVYIGVFLRKRPSPFTQEDETLTPDSQSYDEDSKETTVDRVQRLSTV
nr:uncharacterized protein CI109_006671 [Kwoniella shandongensis]KAA5525031.1 hypothetical protein CI109_006671 [Kwoniella shandongensis]